MESEKEHSNNKLYLYIAFAILFSLIIIISVSDLYTGNANLSQVIESLTSFGRKKYHISSAFNIVK